MSQKQYAIRSNAEAHTQESPMIDTESCNVCSGELYDSDSEAGLDSREMRLLEEADDRDELADIIARFWSKVDKSGECWLWTASTMDRSGHGQFTVRDASRKQHHLYAHRVSWALHGYAILPDLKLCHTCDVPPCVRPSHLFIGTQGDNLTDARQKGRMVDGLHARKLSDDAYRDILSASTERGNGIRLAAKYGVSEVTISRIRRGKQGVIFHSGLNPVADICNVEIVPQAFHVRHRPTPVISTISPMFGR